MFKRASECIRLTLFELQGKYISHVLWINNIKKGLFSGSLFSRDKCGLSTEVSNVDGKKVDADVCSWPRDYTCPCSDVLHGPLDKKLLAGWWLLFADLHARETVWPEARCTSACLWCCVSVDSHVRVGSSLHHIHNIKMNHNNSCAGQNAHNWIQYNVKLRASYLLFTSFWSIWLQTSWFYFIIYMFI